MINLKVWVKVDHRKTFSFIWEKWKQVDLFHVEQVPFPDFIHSFVTVS